MEQESQIPIINHNGQTVWLSFEPLVHLTPLGAYDFSLVQSRIRQAIKKPNYVFAKHSQEIYVGSLGNAVLAVHVTITDTKRAVAEIEPIANPTANAWASYTLVHYPK